ncbi:hypothetical protein L249_3747 [Ophiocordyceps polyrhachis-furcata BCC 54312]|uniref:Ceramide glucosyltransferase n=1 Tax=Ophiocordyceps polyrhachis-furcata BCC 54312 TaxID=1330021 RepID=A0A367L4J6_9HYPO|nr:hypothetical protein L249_3747 [Ophiocordyceps polyrhachis-furcata BCC 54312]
MFPLIETVAFICLIWSAVIVFVQAVGTFAVFRFYSRQPPASVSSKLAQDAPMVTIIRPVKGTDPYLYECLASTFQQDYPSDRVSIRFCVEDDSDAAYPVLAKVIADFPAFDARILVEAQDPALHGPEAYLNLDLGPNPKIRNISRAYREAEGDIIWVIDCNVWVSQGVLGRMVDKLQGLAGGKPYKFVHQMPLVVDVTDLEAKRISPEGGGRLDEMFMATTHVKFYGAINAVGIAPCIVGKSNMFRKSHLDWATTTASQNSVARRPSGVDYFSHNICEDHLIGDLLWRSPMAGFGNHGLAWGDLVIQPMAGVPVAAYAARRTRWLRARKMTVPVATLVEPGVESLLCCGYLSFAMTTLPWFAKLAPPTWKAAGVLWTVLMAGWMAVDYATFRMLHSGATVEVDGRTPRFARGTSQARTPAGWLAAWLGRELMALPVWTWAVLLGTTVSWRGRTFHVNWDASVVDVTTQRGGKDRVD